MSSRARSRLALVLLLPTLAVGCYVRFGERTATFKPARGGRGVDARIAIRSGEVRGELLAVDDSSFTVSADGERIVVVPFRAARRADFGGAPPLAGGTPTARERERLRLVSRFSPGITPAIMAQLLARSGQQAPELRGQ